MNNEPIEVIPQTQSQIRAGIQQYYEKADNGKWIIKTRRIIQLLPSPQIPTKEMFRQNGQSWLQFNLQNALRLFLEKKNKTAEGVEQAGSTQRAILPQAGEIPATASHLRVVQEGTVHGCSPLQTKREVFLG